MISTLVPSFDRSAQCHLLLESLERNAPGLFLPYILWKASDDVFERGYALLQERWRGKADFARETSFEANTLEFLVHNHGDLVAFFTDDCIVYDQVNLDLQQVVSLFYKQVWCVSLRLGLNTTMQNYLTGQRQPLPFKWWKNGDVWAWNWSNCDPNLNYGYMFSWDGCVYRADDLTELLTDHRFKNPREFEAGLSCHRRGRMMHRPLMVAPLRSKVVVNSANCVQRGPGEVPAGLFYGASPEELNRRYLGGEVIDLGGFDFASVEGSHGEFPFIYRRF